MNKVKHIAEKLFKNPKNEKQKGIWVSVEELIEQKKYTKYINQTNKQKTLSRDVGSIKSAFKGRGIEFEEIRAYEFGDEIRDIDWRVTARKQQPYTRIYNEERNREIYVFLDLSPSMVWGTKKELKSVSAAKVTALLAWVCLENKDKFGCFIFDGKNKWFFKPSNSHENIIAIFKKISEITKNIVTNQIEIETNIWEKNINIFQKQIKSHASVFFISDFYNFNEQMKKNMANLAKKGRLHLIDIYDKLEKIPPKSGEYMISNKNYNIIFNTYDKKLKDRYTNYFVQKNHDVRNFCLKFSCNHLTVNNATPAFRQITL